MAKMDRSTLMITIVFVVLIIGLIASLIFGRSIDSSIRWIIIIILMAALISSFLMIPKVSINGEIVHIKNAFVNINIPEREISTVKRYKRIGFNLRIFGVGGLFGYFGYFNGGEIWYVTNIKKKVKITTRSGKIYIISPEDPDGFLEAVNNRIPA